MEWGPAVSREITGMLAGRFASVHSIRPGPSDWGQAFMIDTQSKIECLLLGSQYPTTHDRSLQCRRKRIQTRRPLTADSIYATLAPLFLRTGRVQLGRMK
jgi:hypothetical protein